MENNKKNPPEWEGRKTEINLLGLGQLTGHARLFTVRSILRDNALSSGLSAVAVLEAVAASNFLIAVLVADLTILLRRVLCSMTLTRLIADLMFGKGIHLLRCIQ